MDRDLSDNLIEAGEQPSVTDNGRALPASIESEMAILSLCLKNNDVIDYVVDKKLVVNDFFDKRHQLIFKAISDLYLNDTKVDHLSVTNELRNQGKLNQAGGFEYLLQIMDFMAVASNLENYVSYVHDKSSSRHLIEYLNEMTRLAYDDKNKAASIIDTAVGGLSKLRDSGSSGLTSLAYQLRANLTELHNIATGVKKIVTLKTGFKGMDYHLGGLKPGALYIIAARPGMGKTSLALNIATNIAINYNKTVCFFSLEMSKKEVANKVFITQSTVDAKKLQRATITSGDEMELTKALSKLSGVPLYIDDDSQTNPITMRSKIKQKQAEGQVSVVVVDYLQLMTMPNVGRNSSRQQEISDISRSLKLLAMELQIPVIALSQLSRGAEQREDHTPMLSDLRDSGAIEQDADAVIFIDRDSYYRDKTDKKPNKKGENETESSEPRSNSSENSDNERLDAKIIIAKNRAGSTGTTKVIWYPARTLFYDPVGDNMAPPEGYSSKVSAFRRTTDSASASGNYNFDDSTAMPPEPPDPTVPPFEPGIDDVPPFEEDSIPPFEEENVLEPVSDGNIEEPLNQENQDFFQDDFHTDLPPDF